MYLSKEHRIWLIALSFMLLWWGWQWLARVPRLLFKLLCVLCQGELEEQQRRDAAKKT